ncbi:MAG: hypothetical protein ACLRNW_27855 [Neglectibacter sp.]
MALSPRNKEWQKPFNHARYRPLCYARTVTPLFEGFIDLVQEHLRRQPDYTSKEWNDLRGRASDAEQPHAPPYPHFEFLNRAGQDRTIDEPLPFEVWPLLA